MLKNKLFTNVITSLLLIAATSIFATEANAVLSEQDRALVDKQKNLLTNPGAENGKGAWTASGGSFAIVNSGSNLLEGNGSFTFDASATSQTVRSDLVTIPNGLYGRSCLGKIKYLGGDANLVLKVLDGSGNIISSVTLSASTTPVEAQASFVCPSSGSFRLSLESTADAAIIAFDSAYLGENYNIGTVAQATYFGGVDITKVASGSNTITSTYPSFTTFNNTNWTAQRTNKGACSNPSNAGDLGCQFTSLPPGDYLVVVASEIGGSSLSGGCYFRATETVSGASTGPNLVYNSTGQSGQPPYATLKITTGVSNANIVIQAARDGATNCSIDLTNYPLTISIYQFPSQNQVVVSPNLLPGVGTLSIVTGSSGGSTITSSYPSFTTFNNTNWTSRQTNTGVCQNPSNAGDLGCKISTLPAGDYLVEVNGEISMSSGSGGCYYRALETVSSSTSAPNLVFNSTGQSGHPPYGILHIANQVNNANIVIQAARDSATNCQIDLTNYPFGMNIIPITQYVPMPVIINSLTNLAPAQVYHETATLTSGGTVTETATSDFINGNASVSSSVYTITFNLTYKAAPTCLVSVIGTSAAFATVESTSATQVKVRTFNSGGSATDEAFSLSCDVIK